MLAVVKTANEEVNHCIISLLHSSVCRKTAITISIRCSTFDEAFVVIQGRESFSKEMLDERHQRADDWHRQGAVKARTARPVQPINCATYAQDVIEGRVAIQPTHQHTHGSPMLFGPASVVSGSLSTDRERQIAQVFQPSHRYYTKADKSSRLFRTVIFM